ncbi:hypothetical protein ACHAXH_007627 [Discostella pseudostelligera]
MPPVSRPIPSAISAALETNISLQSELHRLLEKIKCKKVINRRNAARVMKYCRNEGEGDHSLRTTLSATVGGTCTTISESNDSIQSVSNENCAPGKRDECSATIAINESDLSKAKVATEFPPRKKTKLACNSNRKEMRRFFMDKDGSTPKSIMWGMGRENEIEQPASVIFERNDHVSADEEVPRSSWKKAKRCAWKYDSLEEVSFKIVNTPPRSAENRLLPCFSFADPKMAAAKFTKQECNFIMSMITKSGGSKHKSIDWYNFAIEYYDKINQQSPWRCFCLFRSSLQNLSTWSPDEDELLLKYLASHGPQYLFQGDCAVQTCKNLFDRSTKQVILRAQSTLINPNYVQNAWDTNEKRKLALLVRAYSNEPNPINLVSRPVHFSHRAPKSVAEKWTNTLNPAMYHPSTCLVLGKEVK